MVDSKAGPVKFELPDDYEVMNVVGEGAYGVVAQGQSQKLGIDVAIKKVSRVFSKGHIMTKRILREIKMLRHLKHRNILSLKDLLNGPLPTSDEVYIVTELMWGDLARLLRRARRDPRKSVLSLDVIQTLSRQLISALNHMHRANIIHRDLKPQNILIDGGQTPAIKICDFGLARGTHVSLTSFFFFHTHSVTQQHSTHTHTHTHHTYIHRYGRSKRRQGW